MVSLNVCTCIITNTNCFSLPPPPPPLPSLSPLLPHPTTANMTDMTYIHTDLLCNITDVYFFFYSSQSLSLSACPSCIECLVLFFHVAEKVAWGLEQSDQLSLT